MNRAFVIAGSIVAGVALTIALTRPSVAQTSSIDWKPVAAALGREGSLMAGGVYRVGFPRSDLKVSVEGIAIKPTLSLGTYAAFVPMGTGTMVMGDFVVTEDEIQTAMSKLQEMGLSQTAVHKHLIGESPRIWWMHYGGTGDPVKLAQGIRAALETTRTPIAAPASAAPPAITGFDPKALEAIIGRTGKNNGGVYNFTIARGEKITMDGMELPPATGVTTVLNFQPVGDGKAAINGDIAMTAKEVDPVLRALRSSGIAIVEVHQHMLSDEPHLFYTHFWAVDDAQKLARGLRTAVDQTNTLRP